jgi:glycosyltransferase involved in cell wall biosynthesis
MDLLFVTGRFPQRSETFIYRKAVALADRGHHVTVATRQMGDWSLYPTPLPAAMKIEELPPSDALDPRRALFAAAGALKFGVKSPAATRRLYALCERNSSSRTETLRRFARHLPFLGRRLDLVHFEFLGLAALYPFAGEVMDVPVIVSCRGQDVHTLELRPLPEREALIACLRRADAIHCVSDEMARAVGRISGRRHALWVNRPAVDTEHISPRPTRSPSRPLRILASGRLVWVKGFDYLLAAFARLRDRGIEFEADLLGDGPLKSALRFSIGDLELTRHVRLVGGVSSAEVLSRLQATDLYVLSSLEEGISNGVLEAMASGVPIVTTNAGGMSEAVTDGVEGLVVPIRDVDALATALERLATDDQLRLAMGKAARGRAETDFSMARQVTTFETIYRSIAKDRR